MFFLASLIGFVFFFIAVLATSKTKQSARTVFVTFTNLSGWNDGTAFMLGVGSAMYSFVATDTATHLAEVGCHSPFGWEILTRIGNPEPGSKCTKSYGSHNDHWNMHISSVDSCFHVFK